MTNKATKRALLTSVFSLLLCFVMLIGTTFAWFTDTVTSTRNVIESGNLDVELYYQVVGQNDWTKVTDSTNIFKENALWEPGYTEVVKLKVVNEGSLALKYQLGVNVFSETGSVNVAGEGFKLSDYIMYGIVDGDNNFGRSEAIAAVTAPKALKVSYTSDTIELLPAGDAGNKDEKIVTLVVYMPETVGNEANYANGAVVPKIELGINLVATQQTYEADSFDEFYDSESLYSAIVDPVNGALIDAGNFSIVVPADAVEPGVTTLSPVISTPAWGTIIPSDAVSSLCKTLSIDINIDGIKEGNTAPVKVEYVVPGTEEFVGVEVYHNGTKINGATYDPATRTVSFETTSFSPYTFVFDAGVTVIPESYTNDEAIALLTAAKDGAKIDGLDRVITFADNVANKWSFLIQNGVTFQNMTLKAKGDGTTVMVYGKDKNVKMKNVTFQNTKSGKKALEISTNARKSLVFENCTIKGKAYVQGPNITFDGCSFNTNINLESATNVTFKNSTFTVSGAITMNTKLKNILFEGNTFKYANAIRLYKGMPQPENVKLVGNSYKTTLVNPDDGVDYAGWKANGAWVEENNTSI